MPEWLRWLGVSAVVIAADQWSKLQITSHLRDGEVVTLTPWFDLVLARNKGAAFSMLADGDGWQRIFFTVTAMVASAVIIVVLRRHPSRARVSWALSLILGGAIGNLLDRVALGSVVDFIQVHAGMHYFPAFNVADSAITVGAGLLILDSLMKPENRSTPQA